MSSDPSGSGVPARTIALVIEYDGTGYAGWQIQPNALTVQQVVEAALARLLSESAAAPPEGIRVHASGRTDAGVHARAQVAHFRTDASLPLDAFWHGMNTFLPRDVVIRQALEADASFDARRSAIGKHYRYTVVNRPVRAPLQDRYAAWIRQPLDEMAMAAGAEAFRGLVDFASFRATGCAAKTTVRELEEVSLRREGERVMVDVRGKGFLKHMVRNMVGTLIEVGRGRCPPSWVSEVVAARDRSAGGPTAPACGLTLVSVRYPEGVLPGLLAASDTRC